ncbi:MAG TPA: amylo-alpha-1,6-glucosidase [Methanocella sp.]|uniref:amylo-alpha-1,6-glucosidase n=1 Tax=Methanocella sp. TaxID=2052833 RepID=UPI002C6BD70F|nr:amylo-alpha-1,6-glucosidase [Methanocella sp.]HTY90625.1 amylo-alpha-1,6-glucosidase [Methanocella sp.]
MLKPSDIVEAIRKKWDMGQKHTQSNSITNALVIRDGELTLVTLRNGEIPARDNYGYGLYYHDCRYLSKFHIRLMESPVTELLSSDEQGSQSVMVGTNSKFKDCSGNMVEKETMMGTYVVKICPGLMQQSLTFSNFNTFTVTQNLTIEFDADFADMFTIRGLVPPAHGKKMPIEYDNNRLCLSYQGEDGHIRRTIITFYPAPKSMEGGKCHFELRIEPQGSSSVKTDIAVQDVGERKMPKTNIGNIMKGATGSCTSTFECCTDTLTSNNIFNSVIERSLCDLNMMRMSLEGEVFHSAGVPWYDSLFGRDSIISALQLLPFGPDLARSTLLALAKYQGREFDDWRDEEPGKILHELRLGELANLNHIPQTPYYGTVDATPLFLILLSEYVNWTGDTGLLKALEGNVDAALKWIDDYADIGKRGFTSYAVRSRKGIFNQGWKDSFDAVGHSDGSLAKKPVAMAEVQGYVYLAKKSLAPLFQVLGRDGEGKRLENEAKALKERFNRKFWMENKKYFAEALDADGPCDVVASNPGHCLWAGIIDDKYAGYLVDGLFREDMFTGWGIRTLSSEERRYNPLGYHNGTVWPHDNSIIAAGLKKCGFINEMSKLFTCIYEAARTFENFRLPECFCGLPRSMYRVPVKYPVACSPQAWSSGAMPFMFTSCLGLSPDALRKRLVISKPYLPPWLDRAQLNKLSVGGTLIDLDFRRIGDKTQVDTPKKKGDISVFVEY